MSASQFQALGAIVFQLAATLDAYEEAVGMLVQSPADPDLYQRVSRKMDDMRLYAAALPPLAVAWVEVMIRHFELTHAIWRSQAAGDRAADLAPLHDNLREAVQRLAHKCVVLMPKG